MLVKTLFNNEFLCVHMVVRSFDFYKIQARYAGEEGKLVGGVGGTVHSTVLAASLSHSYMQIYTTPSTNNLPTKVNKGLKYSKTLLTLVNDSCFSTFPRINYLISRKTRTSYLFTRKVLSVAFLVV